MYLELFFPPVALAQTFLKMITRNTNARETHSLARELFNDFSVTIDQSSQNSRAVAAIVVKRYGYSTR